MEESSKRKEKLQARRWEASRAVASAQPSHSSPSSIGKMQSLSPSPPLPWLADPPPFETSTPAPRFDFYTDHASSFPASKRMRFSDASGGFCPFSPQDLTPPPPSFPCGTKHTHVDSSCPAFHQMPHQSDSSSYGRPSRVSHDSPWRSAIQFQTPLSGHQGSPVTCPGSGNASGGSSGPGRGFPARPPGSFSSSPQFCPGGSQLSNPQTNRPFSNLGRGRGQYGNDSNSRSDRSGGKDSTRDNTASYFMKSMLEDPWRDMEPVVGDVLEPLSGPVFRLLEPTSGKSNQIPKTENDHKLECKSNLAEFLAASLKETDDDD